MMYLFKSIEFEYACLYPFNRSIMKKYILQPLQLASTEEVRELAIAVIQDPKIRYFVGSPKNGKTALTFKLLLSLLKMQDSPCNPICIALDDKHVYEYWCTQLQTTSSDPLLASSLQERVMLFPYATTKRSVYIEKLKSIISEAINNAHYNFLVLDGFHKFKDHLQNDDLIQFLNDLAGVVSSRGLNIFISSQVDDGFLIDDADPSLVEHWMLTRPDYIGGDILSFGDTRLVIYS